MRENKQRAKQEHQIKHIEKGKGRKTNRIINKEKHIEIKNKENNKEHRQGKNKRKEMINKKRT